MSTTGEARATRDALTYVRDLSQRLNQSDDPALSRAVLKIAAHIHELVRELHPSSSQFHAVLGFLTEVGHHSDSRRHEWALLADVLGVSSLVEALNSSRPPGATPNTVAGQFYRGDAPLIALGDDISRDGKGQRLDVTGQVKALAGQVVAGAEVEVWQANSDGIYENQDPDGQPEFNLRGRLVTDARGGFRFRSVKPKGYSLPADGPVGRLMMQLGLGTTRPAHLHFRVSAAGYETLTTLVFDRDDPAIEQDALFGIKPELLAHFRKRVTDGGERWHELDLTLVLCPLRANVSSMKGRR